MIEFLKGRVSTSQEKLSKISRKVLKSLNDKHPNLFHSPHNQAGNCTREIGFILRRFLFFEGFLWSSTWSSSCERGKEKMGHLKTARIAEVPVSGTSCRNISSITPNTYAKIIGSVFSMI